MTSDPCTLYRQLEIRRGSTFAWGEQLLHALEGWRRKCSAPGVLLVVFEHFLLPLKQACGLKTQWMLSLCLSTYHDTSKLQLTEQTTCLFWATHMMSTSTLFFSLKEKWEPSVVCKPHYHLPLPHKPQIKGLPFPNHREVPEAWRSRCFSSSYSARHTRTGLSNTIVHSWRESISLKITQYISETFTVVQLHISSGRDAQEIPRRVGQDCCDTQHQQEALAYKLSTDSKARIGFLPYPVKQNLNYMHLDSLQHHTFHASTSASILQ